MFIFFKSQSKSNKCKFEFFKYQTIEHLSTSLKRGISDYHIDIKTYSKKEFNPLSLEKEGKILETLDLEDTIKESKLLEVYRNIIINNLLHDHLETDGDLELHFKKLLKINEATLPVFFYVIKDEGKVYFKKSSDNKLFMKNKYALILKRDEATEFKKENLMMLDMNFDFYINEDEIIMKSPFSFELILQYDHVYKKHKEDVVAKIKSVNVIKNFEGFESACNEAKYYRAFKKVVIDTDFKTSFSNQKFIKKLQKDTENKIKWDDKSKKVEIEDLHIKTVLHIFNGLIGIDIYDEIVTFNEKFKLPS